MPEVEKLKPVVYKPISEKNQDGSDHYLYVLMKSLIANYHPDLVEFTIALVWRRAWKPDKDGKVILGQAVKVSPENVALHGNHCIIRLNEEWFNAPTVPDMHKKAVLDHELCHFTRELDNNGDTKRDEESNPQVRMVRHDLEEFACIVQRYGLYTDQLRTMADAISHAENSDTEASSEEVE